MKNPASRRSFLRNVGIGSLAAMAAESWVMRPSLRPPVPRSWATRA